jgi:hypothetical protein
MLFTNYFKKRLSIIFKFQLILNSFVSKCTFLCLDVFRTKRLKSFFGELLFWVQTSKYYILSRQNFFFFWQPVSVGWLTVTSRNANLTAKGLTDYGTAKADSVTQQWKEAKCIFLNNVAIVLNTKQRVAKL